MPKAPLKIKPKGDSEETVTYDVQISLDKRTFVMRIESTNAASWFEYVMAIYSWAKDELKHQLRIKSRAQ